MALTSERLREVVLELLSRPGHEKVRSLVYELLIHGLGARSTEVDFERGVPEVHGRIDALLGRTVFEFKSDLRREQRAAAEELTRYLSDREAQTDEHFVGIATDGATFLPYELRHGHLRALPGYTPSADRPRDLLAWLSAAVAVAADLPPTPEVVTRELGRGSLAWHVAREELAGLWAEVSDHPDARLKRNLWAQLLERVYGSPVAADDLFFQHTYLTIVAKTMAAHVLGAATAANAPEPADLLSGRPFQEAGIAGAVEADFFDWPLAAQGGAELCRRISLQAARFRLRDVVTDVLKGLYESLVDPEQRHDLGEYYTPDWLAARVCERAIDRPLEQRVLDPACGSGTFLFHAVRRFLAAADQAGLSNRDALTQCTRQVLGVDVHPVAIQIARVTYLLALGEGRLRDHPPLSIPVYLGDSLQWNTRGFLAEREVLIEVPEGGPLLEFPFAVARDPALFDAVIERMLDLSAQGAPAEALRGWLAQQPGLDDHAIGVLAKTYEHLRALHETGRDHIWGFVARNLARPVWLSQTGQRPDVIVGNPPWLAFNYMSSKSQANFRKECQRLGVWVGGRGITPHQDLSAYFFARCAELYLKLDGTIAFVMPYAAMSRRQFEGFRSGLFARRRRSGHDPNDAYAAVRFAQAWAFSDEVQPLFPVPSCTLFAKRIPFEADRGSPATVQAAAGTLPRRDATRAEAERALAWRETSWPALSDEEAGSPYRNAFHQGATMVPRVLCVVEAAPPGMLGVDRAAPKVKSHRSSQEKGPWKFLPALTGNVEARFLRALYLGESVAPYRLLQPLQAVIPWEQTGNRLLDADGALREGYHHLARWMADAERLWRQHGRNDVSFLDQLNYYGKLSAQLPPAPLRVVYSKAGKLPAAALLRDPGAVCDHTLYWAAVQTEAEARYLSAVLNSETARALVADLQARGQWGARHFDKVMFELPIPSFDPADPLHQALAAEAARAEQVAAQAPLKDGEHFVRARQRVRQALSENSVAQDIERLVTQLLA